MDSFPPKNTEDAKVSRMKIEAARRGCGQCGAALRISSAGEVFSKGPYKGRYWCGDCWTLYWDEHPKDLCDDASREFVAEEARQIRLKRGAEILFEDGKNKVYLTPKGTVVFDLRSSTELALNEFDPERFAILLKALKAMEGKVPAYGGVPVPSA